MRTDGIRTLEDLRLRCRVDDITGCWHVQAGKSQGSYKVWLALTGQTVSLTRALTIIDLGEPPKGKRWVPWCGHNDCANPGHRKLRTPGAYLRHILPAIPLAQRAKIAAARRTREGSLYSPEIKADILACRDTLRAAAAKHGLSESMVHGIRAGKRWADVLPAASAFTWRAG